MNANQLIAKRSDHKTAHILHLLLSILTGGLWVPIWILVTVSHANERRKIDKKLAKLALEKSKKDWAWAEDALEKLQETSVRLETLRDDMLRHNVEKYGEPHGD